MEKQLYEEKKKEKRKKKKKKKKKKKERERESVCASVCMCVVEGGGGRVCSRVHVLKLVLSFSHTEHQRFVDPFFFRSLLTFRRS